MNDFLIAQLAREHMNRLAREVDLSRIVREADAGGARPMRRRPAGIPTTADDRASVEIELPAEEVGNLAEHLVTVRLVEDLVGRTVVDDVP